jgi:HAD superfamily hydrolase (TIGR01509 family)
VTALIFDCDGVLADTERDGHLPAFNRTFEESGVPVRWSPEEYGEKLAIGGGKERMASLLTGEFVRANGLPADPDGQKALLAEWHKRKTATFKELVREGRLPGRPGIRRVIGDALSAGWTVAVASTSAEESVRAVLAHAAGEEAADRIPVFAADVVPAKKPDPAIYDLVVRELGLDRGSTLVVEDSRNGLRSAAGAGLRCLVTVNGYTRDETSRRRPWSCPRSATRRVSRSRCSPTAARRHLGRT